MMKAQFAIGWVVVIGLGAACGLPPGPDAVGFAGLLSSLAFNDEAAAFTLLTSGAAAIGPAWRASLHPRASVLHAQ